MCAEVRFAMPLMVSQRMLDAVKKHPDTKLDDVKEMHERIGWLMSAYEIMLKAEQDRPR